MEERNENKNTLQIFNNPEFGEIRTVVVDNEPWFVGSDVAKALGYSRPWDAVNKHVDMEDTVKRSIPHPMNPNKTIEMTIINESGLYSLILSSELPSAKKFKKWVVKEVLPSILKTGSYILPQLSQSEIILKIAQTNVELEKKVTALEDSQAKIEQKLDTAVKIFAASDKSWKETMEVTIRELVKSTGRLDANLRGFLYQDLEAIAGVSLNSRLIRRRTRMKDNGASYKECQAVSKLDIISYDKKLRPIFESIIKKYQAVNAMEQLTLVEGQEGLQ